MTETYIALAIVGLAGMIHASFQLGVSVLTLLSGHSLSKKRSQARLFGLTSNFLLGAGFITLLLLSTAALIFSYIISPENHLLIWSILSLFMIVIGLAVWLTYYRKGHGTSLWIPRQMADFLGKRSSKTKHSAEAFSLGMASIFGEILFIAAPLAAAGYAILHLPAAWQLVAILGYTLIASSSLIVVWAIVAFGGKISDIQAWRERNKTFLQFCAATALVVLGAFIYVNEVMAGAL